MGLSSPPGSASSRGQPLPVSAASASPRPAQPEVASHLGVATDDGRVPQTDDFYFLLQRGGMSNPAARQARWSLEGHPDLHRKGNASRFYRAGGHCQLEMWTNSTVCPAGLRRATKSESEVFRGRSCGLQLVQLVLPSACWLRRAAARSSRPGESIREEMDVRSQSCCT